jgi:hypothetical protein
MSKNFTVYKGSFNCKTCDIEVHSCRLWYETGEVSWMCKDKHLSTVQLIHVKKTKKDYEREERE